MCFFQALADMGMLAGPGVGDRRLPYPPPAPSNAFFSPGYKPVCQGSQLRPDPPPHGWVGRPRTSWTRPLRPVEPPPGRVAKRQTALPQEPPPAQEPAPRCLPFTRLPSSVLSFGPHRALGPRFCRDDRCFYGQSGCRDWIVFRHRELGRWALCHRPARLWRPGPGGWVVWGGGWLRLIRARFPALVICPGVDLFCPFASSSLSQHLRS